MKSLNKKIKLTKRQLEGAARNYSNMSAKTRAKYDKFIIMVILPRVTKGKLGFTIGTADGKFLFNAKAIFNALTLNAGGLFTPAWGQLVACGTAIADFETAKENVKKRVLGAEGAKNSAKRALMTLLNSALFYVNQIAANSAVNAVEAITGACMIVVNGVRKEKQDFSVKQGSATGEIDLSALAIKIKGKYVKTTYFWQFSIDGGKTWENLGSTMVAKTTATGMLVGLPTLFRKSTFTTKDGMSDWSPALSIIAM